jgi:hypothetical protein
MRHGHGNDTIADSNCDSHSHSYCHINPNCYRHVDTYCNGDLHPDGHGHGNCYSHGNRYRNTGTGHYQWRLGARDQLQFPGARDHGAQRCHHN